MAPSLLTIAYFVDDYSKMDFYIYDGKSQLITKARKASQYYYQFTANEVGTYKFYFNNINKENKKVTFAIHSGNSTADGSISIDQVDKMFESILKVDKRIGEIKLKQNILNKKFEGHFKSKIFMI